MNASARRMNASASCLASRQRALPVTLAGWPRRRTIRQHTYVLPVLIVLRVWSRQALTQRAPSTQFSNGQGDGIGREMWRCGLDVGLLFRISCDAQFCTLSVWIAAYKRTHSPSQVAWSQGRRPLGAVLHSSNEPSELSQWPCGHDDSTINIVLIIIININESHSSNLLGKSFLPSKHFSIP